MGSALGTLLGEHGALGGRCRGPQGRPQAVGHTGHVDADGARCGYGRDYHGILMRDAKVERWKPRRQLRLAMLVLGEAPRGGRNGAAHGLRQRQPQQDLPARGLSPNGRQAKLRTRPPLAGVEQLPPLQGAFADQGRPQVDPVPRRSCVSAIIASGRNGRDRPTGCPVASLDRRAHNVTSLYVRGETSPSRFPSGSAISAMRPAPATSVGCCTTLPPSAVALRTAASTSST